ncbi:MAG TPA: hypothetical protein VFE07_13555 [Marmoricola sp.]|nr:hypothetical protein [Marmoricola sp.]
MASPREMHIDDDLRPCVWRIGAPARYVTWAGILGLFGLGLTFLVTQPFPDWIWEPLVPLLIAYWLFTAFIVPRIKLDQEQITFVTLYRSRRVRLRDVLSAASGYYGLNVKTTDGDLVSSNVGPTANYTRWRGRISAGDCKAAIIEHRAALARGEDPGSIVLVGKRGAGNWTGAISAAFAAVLRGGR